MSRTATTVSRVSSAAFTELTTSTILALPVAWAVAACSPWPMALMESLTAPERKSEKLAPGAAAGAAAPPFASRVPPPHGPHGKSVQVTNRCAWGKAVSHSGEVNAPNAGGYDGND